MFSVDDRAVKRLELQLQIFANKALPFATRNTINGMAFAAQKQAKENIRNDMVNRNRFSVQSVQVRPEKQELNIQRQEATVGSIAPYMKVQELGGVETKGGKTGVAIATSYSAGQEGKQPRTRLPRKANKLAAIKLRKFKGRIPKNRKQKTLFKVQEAVLSGNRTVFLDLGKRQGIFRVVGGRRKFKRGWPKGARLKMLHDMTNQSVVIPKNPWLLPATEVSRAMGVTLYRKSLEFQLKRFGLFKR